jgi:2-C-methyl-D-erythritol 4-phosphate cytidylyltransferase/2-C-methyl-D-erythritol 2,4-cyclodiphosphate synthase
MLTAVVLAAGSGRRLGGESKVWRSFRGQPLWRLAATAFNGVAERLVVVLAADRVADAGAWLQDFPVPWVAVEGGAERWESTARGVAVVDTPYVAVHDGARPLVTPDLVRRTFAAARETGAAIPALPVVDTVKELEEGRVAKTLPRERLVVAQTPQIFRTEWLKDALARGGPVTDDASWVEALGYPVAVVDGDPMNRKITTPEDWEWLEGQDWGGQEMRIGQGFDIHPLAAGRPLVICGTVVPSDQGAVGDSDADVALHAVMDAALGAAGLGDMGTWFPRHRVTPGSSSRDLMAVVQEAVRQEGWRVVNADVTVVLERPALAALRPAMQDTLAGLLDCTAVSIKFKTADGLGVVGEGRAVAAMAVVQLARHAQKDGVRRPSCQPWPGQAP